MKTLIIITALFLSVPSAFAFQVNQVPNMPSPSPVPVETPVTPEHSAPAKVNGGGTPHPFKVVGVTGMTREQLPYTRQGEQGCAFAEGCSNIEATQYFKEIRAFLLNQLRENKILHLFSL